MEDGIDMETGIDIENGNEEFFKNFLDSIDRVVRDAQGNWYPQHYLTTIDNIN